jgi:hypothetical protein
MEYPVAILKPFHRNWRCIKDGPNSGYSSWAYIKDRAYAKNAEHYVRALILIQNDLRTIFEYLEPSDQCAAAYSYRIHSLFMRTCIEVEANFKAILEENIFADPGRSLNMRDYRKVDATHHLSSYEVMLPIWNPSPRSWKPFADWRPLRGQATGTGSFVGLPWYQAYNASKHDRQDEFKKANFENLVIAVAGLLALTTAQFGHFSFDAGPMSISASGYDYHSLEPSIGSLFRIGYPDDWIEAEKYDFDWSQLEQQSQPDRFERIDFNAIPY